MVLTKFAVPHDLHRELLRVDDGDLLAADGEGDGLVLLAVDAGAALDAVEVEADGDLGAGLPVLLGPEVEPVVAEPVARDLDGRSVSDLDGLLDVLGVGDPPGEAERERHSDADGGTVLGGELPDERVLRRQGGEAGVLGGGARPRSPWRPRAPCTWSRRPGGWAATSWRRPCIAPSTPEPSASLTPTSESVPWRAAPSRRRRRRRTPRRPSGRWRRPPPSARHGAGRPFGLCPPSPGPCPSRASAARGDRQQQLPEHPRERPPAASAPPRASTDAPATGRTSTVTPRPVRNRTLTAPRRARSPARPPALGAYWPQTGRGTVRATGTRHRSSPRAVVHDDDDSADDRRPRPPGRTR
ncbi:hypothetical protein SGLAM104S_04895 [Streptomyces glaucescens]